MSRGSLVFRFQATPFVILFVERAGSTYLMTALRSQPGILAVTEKLAVLREQGRSAAEQLHWTRTFLTPQLVGHYRAVGFKTKLVDVLDPEGFASVLRQRRCKIVQLQRRNAVKGVVSTLNALRQWHASGNWNLFSESTRLAPFAVDPEKFERLLRERETLDRELDDYVRHLRLPTLKLFYEDLLRGELEFVGRTLDFLGSRQQPRRGETLKNTGDDLRQAILNFDTLRGAYAGTCYEAMFDEVLVHAASGQPTECSDPPTLRERAGADVLTSVDTL